MAWLNEIDTPKPAVINVMKRTASGKGWIIETAAYDVFIWNSDKMLKQLLIAVTSWADVGEAKTLQVVPDASEKRKFRVEPVLDSKKKIIPIACKLTESGFCFGGQIEEDETNPFL